MQRKVFHSKANQGVPVLHLSTWNAKVEIPLTEEQIQRVNAFYQEHPNAMTDFYRVEGELYVQ